MPLTTPKSDCLKPGLLPILELVRREVMPVAQVIEAFLDADCDLFIVRQKDMSDENFAARLAEIGELSRLMSFRFIVHHAVAVAAETGAAGVHLTSQSTSITKARALLGHEAVIGYSAHGLEEAEQAQTDGANYILLGAIFDTPKPHPGHPILGLETLTHVCRSLKIPVYAIGGINETNIAAVKHAGAAGFSALRALYDGGNVEHNAAKLGFLWEDA